MTTTVLVPTDGSWNKAPEIMPPPHEWVLVLRDRYPQIGFANPDDFSGWAVLHCKKKTAHFEVFTEFDKEVYWAPLTAFNELRFCKEAS
jgi:hypothetical protein